PPQDRRPSRSAPDRDLLRPSPGRTDPLDPPTPGRRVETPRPRHSGLRRNGAAGVKKNQLQPWRKKCWCIPERDHARFIAQMEDVLDLYHQSPADDEPLICMDEASKQLLDQVEPVIPVTPGQ